MLNWNKIKEVSKSMWLGKEGTRNEQEENKLVELVQGLAMERCDELGITYIAIPRGIALEYADQPDMVIEWIRIQNEDN